MELFDLLIIGAGPAGLIAAGRASELGARVLILEKNKQAGIKLLMTGGGRCNFTNNASRREFVKNFGNNGSWLLSGLSRFNQEDIIKFFSDRNIKSAANSEGKVFPENNSASKIRETLINYVETNGGEIRYNSKVIKIVNEGNKISKIIMADRSEIIVKKIIIATGGSSYPLTGSSGDAYLWLKDLGHNIIKPCPALCPIKVKGNSIKELAGLSFSGASLCLYKNDKKIKEEAGDFIFTVDGLSGPAVLNLSRYVARENKTDLKLKVDFIVDLTKEELTKQIQNLIDKNSKEAIRNILSKLTQKRLVDYLLKYSDIDPLKKGALISKEERELISGFLKGYFLNIIALGNFNEAMITSGGVDLKEVDQKTMRSKLYSNLYFVGEILDLDGPTGGYNLQISWTSGYLAGESAALHCL